MLMIISDDINVYVGGEDDYIYALDINTLHIKHQSPKLIHPEGRVFEFYTSQIINK